MNKNKVMQLYFSSSKYDNRKFYFYYVTKTIFHAEMGNTSVSMYWTILVTQKIVAHTHTHNSRAGHVHATLRLETSIMQSRCVLWHTVYFFCCKCVGYACTIKLIKPIMTHTDHDHVEDLNQPVSARVYSSTDPCI